MEQLRKPPARPGTTDREEAIYRRLQARRRVLGCRAAFQALHAIGATAFFEARRVDSISDRFWREILRPPLSRSPVSHRGKRSHFVQWRGETGPLPPASPLMC